MKNSTKNDIIVGFGGLIICVLLLAIYFIFSPGTPADFSLPKPTPPIPPPVNIQEVATNITPAEKESVGIVTKLEINDQVFETRIENQTNVYEFMKMLRDEGKINFVEKTYIGMGKLIVSINGIKSNGQKTWIYYVNGQEAKIGISNYQITPGDTVSWKYEAVKY